MFSIIEKEKVPAILDRFRPIDYVVESKNVEFKISDERLVGKFYLEHGGDSFVFNKHGLNQLLKNLHPNLSYKLLWDLNPSDAKDIVNYFLNKRSTVLRFRTRSDTVNIGSTFYKPIIAVLSNKYRVVNHIDLMPIINKVMDDRYKLDKTMMHVDWDSFIMRYPSTKISDDGLGVYFGVSLKNGQTGIYDISVDSMIYEKICTNGMIRTIGTNCFLKQRHLGRNIVNKFNHFDEWYNSVLNVNKAYFNECTHTKFNKGYKFIETMYKTNPLITKKMAKDMLQYVMEYDRSVGNNEPTKWSIIRGLTKVSQTTSIYNRVAIDEVAERVVNGI